MSSYPRYAGMVVAYMVVLIAVSTAVTSWFGGLSPEDSFYFVVQTLWTVGYGDVVPSGETGMWVSTAVILLGTIGITSALGVVGGMVLEHHSERGRRIDEEIAAGTRHGMEALYAWGERNGVRREDIDRALGEADDEG